MWKRRRRPNSADLGSRQETPDRALVEAIAEHHLAVDVKARWLRLLRPALLLRHAGPADTVAGWLGGRPELPDGVPWPVWEGHGPLSFVAGLDCTALKSNALDIPLPSEGILLLFYFDGQYDNGASTVGYWDPTTLAGARLLHVPTGETTRPRDGPNGLTHYQTVNLAAREIVTFPTFEHPDLQAAFMLPDEDLRSFLRHPVNGDAFQEALHERFSAPRHQVGGYATPVQGPVEYEVSQAALGGRVPVNDPELANEILRWTLVAQSTATTGPP